MKQKKLTAFLVLFVSAHAHAAERDARADSIGREFIAALGGEKAWERARQFQFDFVVERDGKRIASFSHVWDRYTGDYRLTGTDKAGAPFAVYFNVNTKEGKAFVNGRLAEGEARDALVKNAYGRFINDTYWLLAPWKIFDPGVRLTYDGEKPCPAGGTCDVMKLSFEGNVGLTPKDIYWLWITREGRQMVQWQYLLNGAEGEPTTASWKDWQKFAGISLSLEKPISGRPAVIRFEKVSVSRSRDESSFTPPASP